MEPTHDEIGIYNLLMANSATKMAITVMGRGLTYRMCTAIKNARKGDETLKGVSISDIIYFNDISKLERHNDIGPKTLARISIVREKIQKLVNSHR